MSRGFDIFDRRDDYTSVKGGDLSALVPKDIISIIDIASPMHICIYIYT